MLQPRAALTHERVLSAFQDASATFLTTIRDVRGWEAAGLGEWTVRELVAHTLRAYTTIETYLDAEPSTNNVIDNATAYYRTVMSAPGVHEGVAQRGHDAGRELTDPLAQSDETATRIMALVMDTPGEQTVENFAGKITFTEYLATRTVELALHTLDIQAAIGRRPAMPSHVTTLCLDVLLPLADDIELLRAISGRGTLDVLG